MYDTFYILYFVCVAIITFIAHKTAITTRILFSACHKIYIYV
jgi:energy-converting hydrogenase Eha subunit E